MFKRSRTLLALFCRLAACALLLGSLPQSSWASASCKSNFSTFTLAFPATVAVARDLPNGSILTGWVSSPATSNLFTCTVSGSWYTGTDYELAGITTGGATAYTASYNGTSFSVYPTNVPGVGIAMGGYIYNTSKTTGPLDFAHLAYEVNNNGATTNNGGQLIAALVKIGDVTPGTVQTLIAQAFSWETAGKSPPGDNLSSGIVDYNMTPVVITVLTCQTPNVNVPMGIQGPADLPVIGAAPTKSVAFNMQFNNCPAGTAVSGTSAGLIHSVQYRIDPSNGTVAGIANVAALNAGSSAGGVGIQLYDSTGAVISFGTQRSLTDFNGTTGGSYAVPMTARYYRTGTLSAGTANATMTMTVLYQ